MTDRRRLVTALGLGAGLGFVGIPPLRAAETSDEEPWDVLVVGSGAAGLSAALAADEAVWALGALSNDDRLGALRQSLRFGVLDEDAVLASERPAN